MKTTLEIDDGIYRQTKAAAVLSGRRMMDMVNDGPRLALRQSSHKAPSNAALGCLKKELKRRSITQVMDELRGTVDLTTPSKKLSSVPQHSRHEQRDK